MPCSFTTGHVTKHKEARYQCYQCMKTPPWYFQAVKGLLNLLHHLSGIEGNSVLPFLVSVHLVAGCCTAIANCLTKHANSCEHMHGKNAHEISREHRLDTLAPLGILYKSSYFFTVDVARLVTAYHQVSALDTPIARVLQSDPIEAAAFPVSLSCRLRVPEI